MISLEDWRARGEPDDGKYLHAGHPVFHVDEGPGGDCETLLLIHGFPTASWDWTSIWPGLVKKFRCVAPDMMGFGFSAKPYDYPYSILDQADLHEGLLHFLGLGRVHILAHDYGDTVAQELLARFLDRQSRGEHGVELQSVCLLNGGLFPETHRARLVQKLLNSPLGPLLSRLMSKGSFNKSFSAVFGAETQPTQQELDAFWTLVSSDGGTRIAHKLIRYINERREHRERWVGALQKSTIPLRVINGPADPVSGRHMTERYRELVPNPDIVLLGDGIGHYPQVEDPEGVMEAFLNFHHH